VALRQAREEQSYCGWGSYEWEFRCEAGLWKISRMFITLDCMTTLERGWGMLVDRILPFPSRERVKGRSRTMPLTMDAYTPREIAHKIETLGVTKARRDTLNASIPLLELCPATTQLTE
jgi:hypothetical protein